MDNKTNNHKHTFTMQEKESNRNFSVNSEEMASFVIEKIISLAITEEQRRRTDDQIPNKCFSYLTNMIKNYLKLEFLTYERDDYIKEKTAESSYSHDIQQQNNKTNNWMPISNLKNKAKGDNIIYNKKAKEKNKNIIEEGAYDSDNSDSSHSTIKRENSKQFQSMPSIDSVKLENSFHNKQIENQNHNLFGENYRNIFFDNYFFGVNDWTINEEPVL